MPTGRTRRIVLDNLGRNNPVFVQILGICSTLAVTNVMKNTAVMCAGLVFTTACSSWGLSLIRGFVPPRVRLMIEVLVIACFVIVFDIVIKALLPDVSRQLGPYVGLIITNCIVMGRAEAFALSNRPGAAFADGLSSGLGYAYVLLAVSFVRELLGAGTVWGVRVMGDWWVNWAIMVMPPGAFFVLALFIWFVRARLLRPPAGKGAP